jgi:iron complex outermembrane receptor protein
LNIGIEKYFAQNDIYSAYGTETATPGYALLNAGIGTDIVRKKKTLCSLYIVGTNLTDVAYQSHLSRLKYADENVVTGRSGVYNMGRNISIKAIIPVDL